MPSTTRTVSHKAKVKASGDAFAAAMGGPAPVIKMKKKLEPIATFGAPRG
jgi:hypothetical protein